MDFTVMDEEFPFKYKLSSIGITHWNRDLESLLRGKALALSLFMSWRLNLLSVGIVLERTSIVISS